MTDKQDLNDQVFLSTRELADWFKVSTRTIFNWRNAGLRYFQASSRSAVRFRKSDVLAFLSGQNQQKIETGEKFFCSCDSGSQEENHEQDKTQGRTQEHERARVTNHTPHSPPAQSSDNTSRQINRGVLAVQEAKIIDAALEIGSDRLDNACEALSMNGGDAWRV